MENNPAPSQEANTITNLLRGNALLLTGQFDNSPITVTPLSVSEEIEWKRAMGGQLTIQIDPAGTFPPLQLFVASAYIILIEPSSWKAFGPFGHFPFITYSFTLGDIMVVITLNDSGGGGIAMVGTVSTFNPKPTPTA